MTVQKLAENQESILAQLAAIEQLLKETKGLHISKPRVIEDNDHPNRENDNSHNWYYE